MITLVDLLEASTSFDLNDIHHFINNIDYMAKNGMEPGHYFMLTKDAGLHLLAKAVNLMAGNVDLKAGMYYTLQDAITALGLSDREPEIIQLWNECKIESAKIWGNLANIRNLEQTIENSVLG
jgi:hypothetical protein